MRSNNLSALQDKVSFLDSNKKRKLPTDDNNYNETNKVDDNNQQETNSCIDQTVVSKTLKPSFQIPIHMPIHGDVVVDRKL
jgi:hypothetical protein